MAMSRHGRARRGLLLCACLLTAASAACRLPREDAGPEPARAAAGAPAPAPERAVAPAPGPERLSDDQAVRRALRETTVSRLSFTEDTGAYLEVVALVRTITGIPIVVSPEARTVIADEGLVLELNVVAPLAVENLLDLMVGRSANLGWTVRHGVVMLTSRAEAGGDVVLVTHDVRDLTFARTEFLPPVVRGLPSGELETPRAGGEGDEKVASIEPDSLVQMVKLATDTGYWDREGGGAIEYVDSGYLLVTATPAMQRAVGRALAGLR